MAISARAASTRSMRTRWSLGGKSRAFLVKKKACLFFNLMVCLQQGSYLDIPLVLIVPGDHFSIGKTRRNIFLMHSLWIVIIGILPQNN
jgi:hypothetical protein